ncbi:hypothetical protein [Aureimonas sp. D3]|uniref:hypothetical protein n=1 Tax=Aureimonas sp. D3 TaxID=1638164 RepID=UPI000783B734|nr:hypothetical protein [Aureimonas sp. D3]
MALPALIQAAITRIRAANNDQWDATKNPSGLGQGGHRQNLVKDFNAIADVGEFTAENAESTAADVVKTAADRVQTGKDVTTAGNARDKAKSWANAAEDVDVEPGMFSGFHFMRKAMSSATLASRWSNEAEDTPVAGGLFSAYHWYRKALAQAVLAGGYAAGLKMPAISAAEAGYFVKVNSGGTAYELGQITIATADQIKTGSGKGVVNAETLGPLLQDVATTAIKAYSIGSYMLRLSVTPEPGPNWLECLGQIVPLASYPDLATVLPVYVKQYGEQNVGLQSTVYINGSSGSNFAVAAQWFEGNRLFTLQNGILTILNPDGTSLTGQFNNASPSLWYTSTLTIPGGNIRPLLRESTNEVFYRRSGASALSSIDATSVSTIQNGQRDSIPNVQNIAGFDTMEYLFELPNGTLLFFSRNSNGNNIRYTRCQNLPVGVAHNAWQNFDPGTFDPAQSTINPPMEFIAWQARDGAVYAATRAANSNTAFTLYRTLTGTSWTVVSTFSIASGTSPSGGWFSSRRRESKIVPFGVKEESPDGKTIVVNFGDCGFLITIDSGASWVYKSVSDLLNRSGDGLKPITASVSYVGFAWDKYRSEWAFSCICYPTDSTQTHIGFWAGTDILNLTLRGKAMLSGYNNTNSTSQYRSALIVTAGRYRHSFHSSSASTGGLVDYRKSQTGTITTGPAGISGNIVMPMFRFEGTPFDGTIWQSYTSTGLTIWTAGDDSEELIASSGNAAFPSSVLQTEFDVSADGALVSNVVRTSNPTEYAFCGSFYDYNPALERRLPRVDYTTNQNGLPALQEYYKRSATKPRVYIKVK